MLLILSIFIVAIAVGSVIAEEQKESVDIKVLSESTLKNGDDIEFQLVDAQGNPIASQNLNISFEANGNLENYSVVTDKDGKAYLVLFNEDLGDHKVIVNYTGNDKYNSFKLETSIKIVEGESESEDTEDEATASTVQYDNSTDRGDSSTNSSSGEPSELYYCQEYNFYYDSDGVIHGGQSDGADAFETYMSYKDAEQRAAETGSTDLE